MAEAVHSKLILTNNATICTTQCFIIAEIGQNHQGDITTAKQLIKIAKQCGADCAKFQKTCLKEKFTEACLRRKYSSPNSWGPTYGEHKEHLEFSHENFKELQKYAQEIGILFTASAMDPISLDFLSDLNVPFIKIGSGDSNNLVLIEKAASKHLPLVISTGMLDNLESVRTIYATVSKYHKNFALLHCVSSYPTPVEDIHLNVIKLLQTEFPDVILGYSGHELGVEISIAAVALGCKIIERHITLDKTLKGTDHACSLEPHEFAEMVRKIRTVEVALGNPVKMRQPSEEVCYNKLGKSLVAAKFIPKGSKLVKSDVKIKVSEPKGIDGSRFQGVLGKVVTRDVEKDEPFMEECFL